MSRMKRSGDSLEFIVTATTRPRRAREVDNVDYRFIALEAFQEMIARNELLEWANVYGNFYGVPKEPVRQALSRGRDVVVKVDIQGAASIKKIVPNAVFIFVIAPTMEEMAARLKQRRTESPFDLALRLQTAGEEIKQLPLFDYVVVNKTDGIDLAVSQIKAIITAEKCRVVPREVVL